MDGYEKIGGNKKALDFLMAQSDYDHSSPLQQKYNTRAAALYKDKLNCLSQGKPWSVETSSVGKISLNSSTSRSSSASGVSKSKSTPSFNNEGTTSNGSSYGSGYGSSYQSGYQNSYQSGYQTGYQDPAIKNQTEAFFERVQNENLSRPDHVPPSQGGRYSGFGNTNYQPPPKSASVDMMDTAVSSLAQGWSLLSLGATKVAAKAVEYSAIAADKATVYGQVIGDKVREGKLLDEISDQASAFGSKVTKAAQAISSGQSLSSVLLQPQHQRLDGIDSAGPSEGSQFKSGPERAGLLNNARSESSGYQKLQQGRNDSWADDGWNSWTSSDKNNSSDKSSDKNSNDVGKTFAGFDTPSVNNNDNKTEDRKVSSKPKNAPLYTDPLTPALLLVEAAIKATLPIGWGDCN
ncbi:ADP-ribosylation factor GTPase-activating protein 1 [Hyalella azteca]|uniref:ADP-ribosylation factor GTPase-activating protein 1 n=1 Tax=Hyalella azteca TaxID=294128 RepID=A0A8B7NM44_HYAAZ|nr:ADP-ribosylation factor GTPase-activating protein 1 [Hyalella azteca]